MNGKKDPLSISQQVLKTIIGPDSKNSVGVVVWIRLLGLLGYSLKDGINLWGEALLTASSFFNPPLGTQTDKNLQSNDCEMYLVVNLGSYFLK